MSVLSVSVLMQKTIIMHCDLFVISEILKENKDSLTVDLDNNDSLLVALHNQDQDSRIVDLHNNIDVLIVDLHNQDKDSRIIAPKR